MYIVQLFKISLKAITTNKVRAVLTVLGIIIGIAAVIAMLGIGQGAQNLILEQVQGLGSNTITVIPVGNFSGFQSQAAVQRLVTNKIDADVLKTLRNEVNFPEIEAIDPSINNTYEVSYKSNSAFVTVSGITDEFYPARERELTAGRGISSNDNEKLRNVAVLGPRIAEKLFEESDPLEKTIKINGKNYQVVGIHEEVGSNFDNNVYIPISNMAYTLSGERDYSQIVVKVKSEDQVDPVATKLENALLKFYRLTDINKANFTVFTSKDVLTLTSSITGIFTTLLASIAGISLVVGGIGIMNIMLVSVTERTREIGLRKAVGAKQSAILWQFLLEAILLTLVGGLIGIALGGGMALLVGQVASLPVVISGQSILLATSVSVIIGVVFGFYPAYRAARLSPIDALRYE